MLNLLLYAGWQGAQAALANPTAFWPQVECNTGASLPPNYISNNIYSDSMGGIQPGWAWYPYSAGQATLVVQGRCMHTQGVHVCLTAHQTRPPQLLPGRSRASTLADSPAGTTPYGGSGALTCVNLSPSKM
jgi:hypothetical protein